MARDSGTGLGRHHAMGYSDRLFARLQKGNHRQRRRRQRLCPRQYHQLGSRFTHHGRRLALLAGLARRRGLLFADSGSSRLPGPRRPWTRIRRNRDRCKI